MAGGFNISVNTGAIQSGRDKFLDASKLVQGLDDFDEKSKAALQMYAESAAAKLESYMKEKRPWTDRTGSAKARLKASAEEVPKKGYRITLAHGVDYGIHLELANEKRFAIVQPTIESQSGEVMEGFQGLVNKLR